MTNTPFAAARPSWDSVDNTAGQSIARLRWGALLLAVLITLSLPAARLYFDVRNRMASLSIQTQGLADELSNMASAQPERWVYETNSLAAALGTLRTRSSAQAVMLVDLRGREIASTGQWNASPWLHHEATVLDSGVPAATLRAQTLLAPTLVSAAWLGLFSAGLGLATWWLFARVALGSLARAMAGLQSARAEADRAGRARTTFLATMSHEIRTPMNGVLGMTSLLLESHLNKVQRHYVNVIRSSGDSLLTVINDILEFSKVESGKLLLEPLPFQPDALADDVLTLLGPVAASKKLDLMCQLRAGVPPWMVADATRLRQVLLNVVGNAVKFTDTGEVLVVIECPREGRLRYTVRDTGIGMTQAHIDAVFEPFTQADASTTRRFGGTGLGLAISRRLTAAMGGSIDVSAGPGAGSTFVIEIDCHPTPAPAHAAVPVNLDSLRGVRVLLVDDNATNLEIVSTLASNWGMEPTAYLRPADALAGFGNGTGFDLAILDFNMPGTDGAVLASALRRVRPGLPMVLLSSSDSADAARRLFAARVTKPVQRMLLLDTLLNVMSRRFDADELPAGTVATLPAPLEAQASRLSLLRVLVVEDNPVNAIVVRTMLERLGCLSEHVHSGREAVEAANRQPYDLIFMDLLMPELNGIDATRQIRALALDAQPYIVAFTANVMPEDRAACSEVGMNAFLPKPVRLQDLEQCLSAFTRSRYAE